MAGLDRDGTFVDTVLKGWNGGHVLNLAGVSLRLALYTSALSANFSQVNPVYNVAPLNVGEVVGPGYDPGGKPLTQVIAESGTAPGTIKFTASPLAWPSASFIARGYLIYISSMANKAFQVRCFGVDLPVQDGTFTLNFHVNGIWSVPLVGPVVAL
ncbi:hypothetical protein DQ384_05480 [Sphaerisporangium album]|uniref:Uncharacterized protein n=1 Tax=Sphaerisporangium album TaxID=509200 RepID=A0A367FP29_9ACTN|nr:hypothetical protein [Sphaerisporangium album]RCG31994.1 hypothetical protein DQ384_05480 [Sphaerisporangium album]